MVHKGFTNAPRGGKFNTLAENGTAKAALRGKRPVTIKGLGTDASAPTELAKRAKRKTITQTIILSLIDVATKKGQQDRVKAYWNTYHCQSSVVSSNSRLYGNYCGNRFCTLCAGMRKAEIINKYLPVVQLWPEPYFVTLTAKAVPAYKLKSRIERMQLSMRKLLARNKKRSQRGKGTKLLGIKSIECNFNPEKRTYNPHFHLIVSTKAAAELIINEWLAQCTPAFATRVAQNMRRVDDCQRDLVEVVKYGSKLFTDPTMKKKARRKVSPYVYVAAFHNIIWAMQGHRVFDRFGFNLPPRCNVTQRQTVTDYEVLKFDPQLFDWVSPYTGALLTLYQPEPELMAILKNNIDLCNE